MMNRPILQQTADATGVGLCYNVSHLPLNARAELDRAREKVFQLPDYRADQLAVINASMAGHDCVLIMPTGGGKR